MKKKELEKRIRELEERVAVLERESLWSIITDPLTGSSKSEVWTIPYDPSAPKLMYKIHWTIDL